jgi:hypothetical protein
VNPLKKMGATAVMLGEAFGRISDEYRDLAAYQDGSPLRTFDAIVFVAPLAESERQHLIETFRDLQGRRKIPLLPEHSIAVGMPRDANYLYAQVTATSGESAMQIIGSLMRAGLKAAGLTCDEFKVECIPAADLALARRLDLLG